jgi:hypothetical protein
LNIGSLNKPNNDNEKDIKPFQTEEQELKIMMMEGHT